MDFTGICHITAVPLIQYAIQILHLSEDTIHTKETNFCLNLRFIPINLQSAAFNRCCYPFKVAYYVLIIVEFVRWNLKTSE